MLKGYDEVAVFLGLDVGKEGHHAVAQDRSGKKLLDRALPNDEAKLRELYGRTKAHGPVLLVVDQPATIGALPVAVAPDEGITVAYRVSPGPGDTPDRRPAPRFGQDRRPRRCRDCQRRADHAAHPAGPQNRRRK